MTLQAPGNSGLQAFISSPMRVRAESGIWPEYAWLWRLSPDLEEVIWAFGRNGQTYHGCADYIELTDSQIYALGGHPGFGTWVGADYENLVQLASVDYDGNYLWGINPRDRDDVPGGGDDTSRFAYRNCAVDDGGNLYVLVNKDIGDGRQTYLWKIAPSGAIVWTWHGGYREDKYWAAPVENLCFCGGCIMCCTRYRYNDTWDGNAGPGDYATWWKIDPDTGVVVWHTDSIYGATKLYSDGEHLWLYGSLHVVKRSPVDLSHLWGWGFSGSYIHRSARCVPANGHIIVSFDPANTIWDESNGACANVVELDLQGHPVWHANLPERLMGSDASDPEGYPRQMAASANNVWVIGWAVEEGYSRGDERIVQLTREPNPIVRGRWAVRHPGRLGGIGFRDEKLVVGGQPATRWDGK